MKRIIIAFIIICLLSANALAAAPEGIIHTEEDGYKYITKTYELPPEQSVESVLEEPFELLGYSYCVLGYTRENNEYEYSMKQTETVTIETGSKDMPDILAALDQTIRYEKDGYTGELLLDHKTISTEASGNSSKSYSSTTTKTYPGLDRNDPGYIPQTAEKNGTTLSLSNIEWSVDAVDGDLIPISYTAVATYSGRYSSKVADGYITTASYSGTITKSGISSVVYTITYVGERIEAEEIEVLPEKDNNTILLIITVAALLLLAVLFLWILLLKSNTKIYVQPDSSAEYTLIRKIRLSIRNPVIKAEDIHCDALTFEISSSTARRLFGKLVTIKHSNGEIQHLISQPVNGSYWFSINTYEEEY